MNVINKLKAGDKIKVFYCRSINVDINHINRSDFEWVYTVSYLDSDYLLIKYHESNSLNYVLASYKLIKIENEWSK